MSDKKFLIDDIELMKEWNWEKNKSLNIFPDLLSCGTTKRVWWKCKICNHEWQTSVGHRTYKSKPTNCPKCAVNNRTENRQRLLKEKSNIKITYPEILDEWDYTKNEMSPESITKGSHAKIWWKCKNCHSWQTSVGNRIKGHGCPYCSGRFAIKGINDLQTVNPLLAKEWNYNKNGNLKPEDVKYGSTKKVWWKCKNGHEWFASISNRNKKRGCPICSKYRHVSLPEKAIYYYFSQKFQINENIKINKQMELDLFFPELNLGIEYDGRAWHKNLERDLKKDELCESNNIKLIRIREKGLIEYKTSAYIITTQNPDSSLMFMEQVLIEILSFINQTYNMNLSIDINIERDYYSILSLIEKFEIKNSLSTQFPELLKEWNYEKNGNLKPNMISKGSGKKVWWVCKNGHEWKTSIANRTNDKNKNQCPFCQKKKTVVGVNDIVTLNSKFLVDWDYNKNRISPNNFMEHSGVIVWWKCHICGFEWKATIDSRSKHGCRYCSRKKSWENRVKAVKNIETGEIFESATSAGLKYNIKADFIRRVCVGERKTTGGYHWEYVEK